MMLPNTEKFMGTWLTRCSREAQNKIALVCLEYGLGYRDLTQAETEEAGKMVADIVRDDLEVS